MIKRESDEANIVNGTPIQVATFGCEILNDTPSTDVSSSGDAAMSHGINLDDQSSFFTIYLFQERDNRNWREFIPHPYTTQISLYDCVEYNQFKILSHATRM